MNVWIRRHRTYVGKRRVDRFYAAYAKANSDAPKYGDLIALATDFAVVYLEDLRGSSSIMRQMSHPIVDALHPPKTFCEAKCSGDQFKLKRLDA